MVSVGVLASLSEVFAPVRCAGCDLPGVLLCERCVKRLPLIDASRACPRCGARIDDGICGECDGRTFAFEAAVCAGVLDGPLSRAIALYKDAGERRYAPLLGGLAAAAAGRWAAWADVVVPVPPTRAALAKRGFDHVAPLARIVGDTLGTPTIPGLTATRRLDQRGLGREARVANMAHAFAPSGAKPGAVAGGRVLLVDDVMTTGATLDAAAAVLRASGALRVRAVAVARAQDA